MSAAGARFVVGHTHLRRPESLRRKAATHREPLSGTFDAAQPVDTSLGSKKQINKGRDVGITGKIKVPVHLSDSRTVVSILDMLLLVPSNHPHDYFLLNPGHTYPETPAHPPHVLSPSNSLASTFSSPSGHPSFRFASLNILTGTIISLVPCAKNTFPVPSRCPLSLLNSSRPLHPRRPVGKYPLKPTTTPPQLPSIPSCPSQDEGHGAVLAEAACHYPVGRYASRDFGVDIVDAVPDLALALALVGVFRVGGETRRMGWRKSRRG
ncbi:hypothetical protein JHW43_006453 [Diplocarpon mali]|nr:hypothetical protein JHW43_006453 [Diplocarpon mali]